MAKSDFLINFTDPNADSTATSEAGLSMSADSTYNTDYYKESRSEYYVNEVFFIKLERDIDPESDSYNKPLELITSSGSASLVAENVNEEVSEYIIFANSNTSELSEIPSNTVTYTWIGNDLGNVVFDGKAATIPKIGVGVIQCIYNTSYDRIQYTPTVVGTNVVVAVQGSVSASYEHDVSEGSYTSDADLDYNIKVLDYCTNDPIQSATVTIDGVVVGVTDSDGLLKLGLLEAGEHTLLVVADGYITNDNDKLDNETFTIV